MSRCPVKPTIFWPVFGSSVGSVSGQRASLGRAAVRRVARREQSRPPPCFPLSLVPSLVSCHAPPTHGKSRSAPLTELEQYIRIRDVLLRKLGKLFSEDFGLHVMQFVEKFKTRSWIVAEQNARGRVEQLHQRVVLLEVRPVIHARADAIREAIWCENMYGCVNDVRCMHAKQASVFERS